MLPNQQLLPRTNAGNWWMPPCAAPGQHARRLDRDLCTPYKKLSDISIPHALRYVAMSFRVPRSRAYGVATFYHFFTLKPAGETYVRDLHGDRVLHQRGASSCSTRCSTTSVSAQARPPPTVRRRCLTARCLGSCGLAPAVVYDQEVAGKVDTQSLRASGLTEMDASMTPEELDQIAQREHAARTKFTEQRQGLRRGRAALLPKPMRSRMLLDKEVSRRGTPTDCEVQGVGCLGLCARDALVSSRFQPVLYKHVSAGDEAPDVVDSLAGLADFRACICPTDVPFFERQKKIVLENSGVIDPERIEDYSRHDGYLAHCLKC